MLPTLWLLLLGALAAATAWIRMPLGTTPSVAILSAGFFLFGGDGLLATTVGLLIGLVVWAWRTHQAVRLLLLGLLHVVVLTMVIRALAPFLDQTIHQFPPTVLALLFLALGSAAATTGLLALSQCHRTRQDRRHTWLAWRLSAFNVIAFNALGLLLLWSLGESGHLIGVALGLTLLAWMAWALRPTFAVATQTARAHRAESDARLDPLTVLPNRRGLEEYVADIQVAGLPAVVAIADVDHFKRVNDTYGHDAGDAVLFAVAQRLRHACRQTATPWPDKVGRWGGEEFVVILPCLPLAAAADRVESVRRAVSASPIRHGGHAIPITCSVGATLCLQTFDLTSAVTRADQALLYAKGHGRDQVAWHPALNVAGPTLSFVPPPPADAP